MPRDSVPALRDLNPCAVALDACTALVGRLTRTLVVLLPAAAELSTPAPKQEGQKERRDLLGTGRTSPDALVDGSELGLTVQTLTVFAQRGCPVGDWVDPEDGADALLTVVSALYGGALDREAATPGILREGEPRTPLEAVLLAAWTRVQLARGEAVEPRQIAVLGSWPLRTVQHHVATGELPATSGRPARVSAEHAVAYLAARGVPGFTAPAGGT